MDVRTMRRVDRWLGAPLCALLTAVRRLDDLLLGRHPPQRPRRIAVLKLAEQGATVLACAALERARAMVGADNLFFVVFEENRFILDLLAVVPRDNVVAIRTGGLWRVAWDALGAVARLRREGVDSTVDFEFFARSTAILSYLSGARSRVGYHASFGEASYRGDLLTHRLSMNPFLHASEMFQVLVAALAEPADRLPALEMTPPESGELPQLRPEPAEVAEVAAIVRRQLGVEELPPLVLLNANCGDLLPLRRWPVERYVELAHRLLAEFPGLAVVLTGAPSERADAAALAAQIGSDRCTSLAGHTTLRQLLVLYGLAELMVTNDSGPAHYATLTPIDVITLFGPESPAVFGARTPRSHLLWAGLVCSPCVNAFNDRRSACPRNLCMEHITVDEVFHVASRVIERRLGGQERTIGPSLPMAMSASRSCGR
jgi:ADP-heptose:LPS heptosyltransferase